MVTFIRPNQPNGLRIGVAVLKPPGMQTVFGREGEAAASRRAVQFAHLDVRTLARFLFPPGPGLPDQFLSMGQAKDVALLIRPLVDLVESCRRFSASGGADIQRLLFLMIRRPPRSTLFLDLVGPE